MLNPAVHLWNVLCDSSVDRTTRQVKFGHRGHLFDERNGVLRLLEQASTSDKRMKKPVGICGQAPPDYPEFAAGLIEDGIHSISVDPDLAIVTALRVAAAESEIAIDVTR